VTAAIDRTCRGGRIIERALSAGNAVCASTDATIQRLAMASSVGVLEQTEEIASDSDAVSETAATAISILPSDGRMGSPIATDARVGRKSVAMAMLVVAIHTPKVQ
jgi:hypothetical protein